MEARVKKRIPNEIFSFKSHLRLPYPNTSFILKKISNFPKNFHTINIFKIYPKEILCVRNKGGCKHDVRLDNLPRFKTKATGRGIDSFIFYGSANRNLVRSLFYY